MIDVMNADTVISQTYMEGIELNNWDWLTDY